VALILIVSLFTPKADEKRIEGLTFASSTAEQRAATRASWNYWDVAHTAVILGVVVAFYIYFW
jgi:SSS family solute:Na+ symporter